MEHEMNAQFLFSSIMNDEVVALEMYRFENVN